MIKSSVVKRSIVIAGHKTSVSLEDEFWSVLKEIAKERDQTLSDLVSKIDADRKLANLSSAIRLFVLSYAHDQAEAAAQQSGQPAKLDGPQAIEASLIGS